MKHQRIAYIRVSTYDQNPDRQLEGMQFDRKFIDNFTGRVLERPQLQEMIKYVREGDELYIHSLDRLARTLTDLMSVIKVLTDKKVKVHFKTENLIFTGDDSPMSILLLSMLGAFAQFELSLNKDRQREGIKLAREKGMYLGRPRVLSKDKIRELKNFINDGGSKSDAAKKFKISQCSVYNYLNDMHEKANDRAMRKI